MNKRTISINPQFFNMTKKKKKIIPSEVNINASNIRQLLLDKLKEHKKTRKIETNPQKVTPILENITFEEKCKEFESDINSDTEKESQTKRESNDIPIVENSDKNNEIINSLDKPYGNLKNGSKPTYKQYQEKDKYKELYISTPSIENKSDSIHHVNSNSEVFHDNVVEEKEIKKTFKLGKSGKKISILIKNNKTRKHIEDKKTEHKKTHLSTVKNYLKEKNLIKFGTTAPSKLLREMFETSELCGGILNQNKDVLIHNFDK